MGKDKQVSFLESITDQQAQIVASSSKDGTTPSFNPPEVIKIMVNYVTGREITTEEAERVKQEIGGMALAVQSKLSEALGSFVANTPSQGPDGQGVRR